MKQIYFTAEDLLSRPELIKQNGVTELTVSDSSIVSNSGLLSKLVQNISQYCPELYLTLKIDVQVLDRKLIDLLLNISCSLEINFESAYLEEKKKFFSRKIALLNESGLVFGFLIDSKDFSTMKRFRLCIDEACSYYPNHIYIDNSNLSPTDKLSSQDIKNIRHLSFALETFYSSGRAVPWFCAVVQSLHLRPSVLLSDFAEWQRCNNCDEQSGFDYENSPHEEIEKMQIAFLSLKYEEKKLNHVLPAATDLIKLHGAFSRCDSDGTETELSLSYNPDDILSPYAMDLNSFAEEACFDYVSIKVFLKDGQVDLEVLE